MRITSRFSHASTAAEVVEGIDLAGRAAIVTGASSGIGVETAAALAAAGAAVTLAVRDQSAGEAVAASLRERSGNQAVEVGRLDLADLASVRSFAEAWLAAHGALHVLIGNAGIMALPERRLGPAGWELQLATNHLGHHLLGVLLAPALRTGAPSRVVSLSSIGHRLSPFVADDPHFERRPYEKWPAYGQSKTANVLFAVGLTERLGAEGVHANAVHPGGIMTNLQRHMDPDEPRRMGWVDAEGKPRAGFKTVEQGAATAVWAATAPELDGVGGRYLEDCNEALPAGEAGEAAGVWPHALDPVAAEQLWALSTEAVGTDL